MTSLRREELILVLPYARRYARALTGSQTLGDRLVAAGLLAVTANDDAPAGKAVTADSRVRLYAAITAAFEPAPERRLAEAAASQRSLSEMPPNGPGLSPRERQLLLLTSLEELAVPAAAGIVGVSEAEARHLLEEARLRLREAAAADVLIIEDEPIIAMDIEELVISCGHRVVGVAASETAAVDIARRTKPGLILADINLGVGGDGTNAVARILRLHDAPVIFVTAYPERLLTGETVEPTFVITKPFDPLTLAIATYQAVTGGVRLD